MQKRRERIEKWREERKKKTELPPVINIVPPSKKWSLEDDDDDDEDISAEQSLGDDEVDPLDAYMEVANTLRPCFLFKNFWHNVNL